jgi:hypothetical protein
MAQVIPEHGCSSSSDVIGEYLRKSKILLDPLDYLLCEWPGMDNQAIRPFNG